MKSIKKILVIIYFYSNLFVLPFVSGQYDNSKLDSLFYDVQMGNIFQDQKKFPDCIPKFDPDIIKEKYNTEKTKPGFSLKKFIAANFDTVLFDTTSVLNHIDNLWQYLQRTTDTSGNFSSVIPLPYNYIVPGGRFREIYYWDSFFTMLGLAEAGKYDLIEGMINNFCYLVNRYGHIPNGNRIYYLSRSQPPFFSLMIELLAQEKGDSVYTFYLPYLEKEYDFWMKGKKSISKNKHEELRVIRIDKNLFLNRYWDSLNIPRPESFKDDVMNFAASKRDSSFFRHVRAAAESGWDFSSRWFKDSSILSINTTNIVPVDLNCLVYHLEKTIAKAYNLKKDKEKYEIYTGLAEKRKTAINTLFWNQDSGFYFDYDFINKKQTEIFSLAGVFPLFFDIASTSQAEKVKIAIEQKFLKNGGVVTTLNHTGEQWDYPNGWPPMQWITYCSLKKYKFNNLADTLAQRWLNQNIKVYIETGKMMEKYDVVNTDKPGGGGEYPLQDGFGWTNGVFLKLWNETRKPE